ncbi:MAG: hypothetical protein ACPL4K_04015 [Candidatus Margulisiibacteriota bacterium]
MVLVIDRKELTSVNLRREIGICPKVRGLWKKRLKESEEIKACVDFVEYLGKKYILPFSQKETGLVFLRHGAAPLEKLARLTIPQSKTNRIIGVVLQTPMFLEFLKQPRIVKILYEAGIFRFEKVVFVDTGFRGSVGKRTIDLLRDERLLRFTAEKYGFTIPEREIQFGIELLCLRGRKEDDANYNLLGYNFVVGRPRDPLFESAAWLIDEGLSQKEKNKPWTPDRVLIAEVLIEVSQMIRS